MGEKGNGRASEIRAVEPAPQSPMERSPVTPLVPPGEAEPTFELPLHDPPGEGDQRPLPPGQAPAAPAGGAVARPEGGLERRPYDPGRDYERNDLDHQIRAAEERWDAGRSMFDGSDLPPAVPHEDSEPTFELPLHDSPGEGDRRLPDSARDAGDEAM